MAGAIQTADILSLNRVVTFECQNVFSNPRSVVWPQKAKMVTSDTWQSVHGFMTEFPEMRKEVGDRIYYSPVTRSFTATNEHYGLGIKVPRRSLRFDSLNVFSGIPALIQRSIGTCADKIITDMQKANPICYDTQNFYDVDHPVNPDNPAMGIFVNTFTTKPLNTANVFAGAAAMAQLTGESGVPLELWPDVLEFPTAETYNAYQALQATMVGQAIKNVAGAENVGGVAIDNMLSKFLNIKPVMNPRLPSTHWYLHCTTTGTTPFLLQVADEPVVVPKFDPGSQHVLHQRELLWDVDADGCAVPTMPHLSMRFQIA